MASWGRRDRLNAQLREEISDLLRREARDPGLAGLVSITSVDVSPDLWRARVYVSVLGDDGERQRALAALQRAAGFLRHGLAQRLTLRHVPELHFVLDTSIERGERIMELLREVRQEGAPAGGSAPESGPSEAPGAPEAPKSAE